MSQTTVYLETAEPFAELFRSPSVYDRKLIFWNHQNNNCLYDISRGRLLLVVYEWRVRILCSAYFSVVAMLAQLNW